MIDELTVDPSNIDAAVEAAFDRIDMRFLERLNERMQEGNNPVVVVAPPGTKKP